MHFHKVLQRTQDNMSKRPLPEQITVQLYTRFSCQNKRNWCKNHAIHLIFGKHCFSSWSSKYSFPADNPGNSQGDELEGNISKLKSLVELSICYVPSCIADAIKGLKTLIPYLFVISLAFIVPLPTENIIPLLAFHKAVAKGFFFVPSL